jgi:integrase
MTADPQDTLRHAGHVVRRVLLRRNIAIDADTAQLVAAAVQAALQAGAPSRPPRRRPRVPPPTTASRCSDLAPATDPAQVQALLGHASIATAARYFR